MIQISKVSLQQNSIFIVFENPWTYFLVLFYNVLKEKMFTNEIENEREELWKPSFLNLKSDLPLEIKNIGIRNFEFVSKTQILSVTMKVKTCLKMKCRNLYKIFRLTLTEDKCKKNNNYYWIVNFFWR